MTRERKCPSHHSEILVVGKKLVIAYQRVRIRRLQLGSEPVKIKQERAKNLPPARSVQVIGNPPPSVRVGQTVEIAPCFEKTEFHRNWVGEPACEVLLHHGV